MSGFSENFGWRAGFGCPALYNATVTKKIISPTPVRSKSNIVPATQPTETRQRKNTDKVVEALHYLVKLCLLAQKMVEIGASQAPQSESSHESRLSYPENAINLYGSAGPWAPQSHPDSHFCLKKMLVLRES